MWTPIYYVYSLDQNTIVLGTYTCVCICVKWFRVSLYCVTKVHIHGSQDNCISTISNRFNGSVSPNVVGQVHITVRCNVYRIDEYLCDDG